MNADTKQPIDGTITMKTKESNATKLAHSANAASATSAAKQPLDNAAKAVNQISPAKNDKGDKPIWFITGCSTGFGRSLALTLLERGYKTVVTSRNTDDIQDMASNENALVLKLDVTDAGEVAEAMKQALKRFGHVDVLVNNAGIGYFAAIEESETDKVRKMFDINFFGASSMIDAVLPSMRERRKGFIVNLSSIGGLCSFPSVGFYSATKFALEGMSEALRQEVAPLGIKVMVVEPSGFRTDWAGRSASESKLQIADYAGTAGAGRKQVRAASGKQRGDPERAAQAIIDVVESVNPPNHLLLGNDAVDAALAKLDTLKKEFFLWEKVSRGADFPVGK
ncbi:oxidoreductase [Sapientia aquatica]|nr:oxidoreductase [Sapientia aquatica]